MLTKNKKIKNIDLHYAQKVKSELSKATWILRITDHKDKASPVFIVKERIMPDQRTDTKDLKAIRSILKERGIIYGQSQRRCLPIIRIILARINNHADIPLELQQYINKKRITFRGNLPLDSEAGYKLVLIFKLQERLKEMDRVELIARRIDRFTMEESSYWYSRISHFSDVANRWAMAGMKTMLAGHSKDPNVEKMLEDFRQKY